MISGMIWASARPGGQIFHGKKGELYQRYHEGMEDQLTEIEQLAPLSNLQVYAQ